MTPKQVFMHDIFISKKKDVNNVLKNKKMSTKQVLCLLVRKPSSFGYLEICKIFPSM